MKTTIYNTLALGATNITFSVNGYPAHIKDVIDCNGHIEVCLQVELNGSEGIHPEFKKVRKPQNTAIKEYLLQGHSITPLEALEMFGCFRLGARIADLKKKGLDIVNDNPVDERTGKRYARYRSASK